MFASDISAAENLRQNKSYGLPRLHVIHTIHMSYKPVEFFRAISSALDVFRWSIRKLGMLNGGTCMLSDENWCLNGRCRSGDGIDKLSNFSLLRCCRSMWSNISCKTYFETNVKPITRMNKKRQQHMNEAAMRSISHSRPHRFHCLIQFQHFPFTLCSYINLPITCLPHVYLAINLDTMQPERRMTECMHSVKYPSS